MDCFEKFEKNRDKGVPTIEEYEEYLGQSTWNGERGIYRDEHNSLEREPEHTKIDDWEVE